MKRFSSLRKRIITASFAMTFVICILFSIGLFIAFEFAESNLFEDHLEDDIRSYITLYNIFPGISDIPRRNFTVYISENGDETGLPDFIRNMSPGTDDIEMGERVLDLEIWDANGKRFYFVIDETSMEKFESNFLTSVLLIVVIICLVSMLLGYVFANRIIRPVAKLADDVNNMKGTDISKDSLEKSTQDEIGVLSNAINSYQQRVNELIAREREFSTDVSHELRTPLMGIQASAENLQINSKDSSKANELSGRIVERCRNMSALIDSLLFLARDPDSLENDFENIKLLDVVKDQLESVSYYIDRKGTEVILIENNNPVVFSSRAILCVLFGNLLRNALFHSMSDMIRIELNQTGFSIIDYGQGMAADRLENIETGIDIDAPAREKSNGIGLVLVKRLCVHYHWGLEIKSVQGEGTTIKLAFDHSLVD